jgi:hypothetical protein
LEIEETGQVFKDTLTSGSLGGFLSDTLTLATGINFTQTYTFKAYFTSILDVNRQNDTLIKVFTVNPTLSVRIRPESGGTTNCLHGDGITNPSIVITNTGNLPLSDIGLKFYVLINGVDMDSVFESHLINNFMPGDSTVHVLASGYTVPWTPYYGLRAEAYLICDSAQVHANGSVSECTDVTDLALDSILSPSGSQIDVAGSQQNITVSLKNRSLATAFQNVKIRASIVDSKGNTSVSWEEVISFTIRLSSDTTYSFTASYSVPNDTAYSIIVSILDENGLRTDNYQKNDTIKAVRKTDYVGIAETGIARISMSQNTPNPATGTTRIDYSLPTDGEVTFHVYTISGQELFNQVVETTSGKHSIDLNTTHLASGIYFYSMEFKGQRIVKRMSVSM